MLRCYRRAECRSKEAIGHQGGYTLIEALIVIGLIGLIVGVAMPTLYRMLQAYRVQTAATQIAIQLRFMRNAAVKQKANYRITVRDEAHGTNPNTYLLQRDLERDGTYEAFSGMDISIPDGVLIKSVSVDEVDFDSRGRASTAGIIRLEGKYAVTFEISISLNGGVVTERI